MSVASAPAPERTAAVVPLRPSGPRHRPWLLAGLGLAATAGTAGWLWAHWGLEETDDAQVQASLVEISSRVPGTIARVAVERDQTVKAGDLLVTLDDRDARAALARAEADLVEAWSQAQALDAQAGSSFNGARAAGNQAVADQVTARAEYERAAIDLRRLETLQRQGGVSMQDVDRARATFSQAQGQLLRSRASSEQAQASVQQFGVDRRKAAAAVARIQQAQAALAEARLKLSYTQVRAPSGGRIGARSAEPGRQVEPGQPLMTLVGADPWVEAHFKETQLQALRPGRPAVVRIDAFPGRRFQGHVLSVAPASGSRFALLPPDNATGNFTKVVQRLTTRISLEGLDPAQRQQLVPGLSAVVQVRRP